MDRRLAQEIYDIAKADETFNTTSDDLKNSMKTTYETQVKQWRNMLKEGIKSNIANNNALLDHDYNLVLNNFPVNRISRVGNNWKYTHRLSIKGKYTRRYNHQVCVTILDKKMRKFLDDVVFKLDLDWRPYITGDDLGIVVTWDHWVKK